MRVLGQRFGGGANDLIFGSDLETAQERLRRFVVLLDARVDALEHARQFDESRLDVLFALPEVTGALQEAFATAMDTDDGLQLHVLADVVVERLKAPDESLEALAARIAIERIRDLTPRQVRLLALISFLQTGPIRVSSREARAREELLTRLYPDDSRDALLSSFRHSSLRFGELHYTFADLAHIRGLGLLDFDESGGLMSTTGAAPIFHLADKAGIMNDPQFEAAYNTLRYASPGDPERAPFNSLHTATVSPAGSLIGDLALIEELHDV